MTSTPQPTRARGTGAGESTYDDDATSVLRALGEPVTTFAPPDPTPGAGLPWSAVLDRPPAPHGRRPAGREWPDPTPTPGFEDDQRYEPTRAQHLGRSEAGPPAYASPPAPYPTYDAPTAYLPAEYVAWEGEEVAASQPGHWFRIMPLLVLCAVAAIAAAGGMFLDVIRIGGVPVDAGGGPYRLNDFGTNLTVAGVITGVTMLLGGLAWCTGYRWGAGLAGGAGAGLAGWAVLPLGAAERRYHEVSAGAPAAVLTRDIGYWCLVGAGGLGVVVLIVSLRRASNDHRAGLDPWVAALGAIATVVAVVGPLIPINDASIEHNWTSPAGVDLPDTWFAARLASLGVLLVCGVFGFLLVRRYGLGLAIGGAVGTGWLVLTSATEQTEKPIGPAYFNPGALALGAADDLKPHLVTVAGISLMLFFAVVATAMALIDSD
jgi:hypothetical protein